jgi:hypothetical protein
MPTPKKYTGPAQRQRAYRARKRNENEQNLTINEALRLEGAFGLEKPETKTWEYAGQTFKIMVITFPLAIDDLEETEKGLLALSNAQRGGYKVIDQERFSKYATRFIRYTLSKRKR